MPVIVQRDAVGPLLVAFQEHAEDERARPARLDVRDGEAGVLLGARRLDAQRGDSDANEPGVLHPPTLAADPDQVLAPSIDEKQDAVGLTLGHSGEKKRQHSAKESRHVQAIIHERMLDTTSGWWVSHVARRLRVLTRSLAMTGQPIGVTLFLRTAIASFSSGCRCELPARGPWRSARPQKSPSTEN